MQINLNPHLNEPDILGSWSPKKYLPSMLPHTPYIVRYPRKRVYSQMQVHSAFFVCNYFFCMLFEHSRKVRGLYAKLGQSYSASILKTRTGTVPTARLIVMIRDPVDRTWSDYLYYSRLIKKEMLPVCFRKEDGYMPSAADFEMSISRQIPLARKCLRLSESNHTGLDQLKRNCNTLWHEQLSCVPFMFPGNYKQCWRRSGRLLVSLVVPHIFSWLRHFPCDQVRAIHML